MPGERSSWWRRACAPWTICCARSPRARASRRWSSTWTVRSSSRAPPPRREETSRRRGCRSSRCTLAIPSSPRRRTTSGSCSRRSGNGSEPRRSTRTRCRRSATTVCTGTRWTACDPASKPGERIPALTQYPVWPSAPGQNSQDAAPRLARARRDLLGVLAQRPVAADGDSHRPSVPFIAVKLHVRPSGVSTSTTRSHSSLLRWTAA